MRASLRVSVYEFSDHVRVALQQVCLLSTIESPPECVLYIRRDCEALMPPFPACDVRYANKYLMMIRFFFEAAIVGRKVLVTTGPEASSGPVKSAFAFLMKLLKNHISIFLIVRDSKADRGQYLMDGALYSGRSLLAVESEALLLAARRAGYAPDGYMYPTPILASSEHKSEAGIAFGRGRSEALRILITGSLDSTRRNYETLFAALSVLKDNRVPVEVVVGGHCLTKSAPAVLKGLQAHCDILLAKDFLTDAELDAELVSADAIVCLNRPEFYMNIKGSGAIGDAFYAGKKLLLHAELAKPESADLQFYMPFSSGEELARQLLKVQSDRNYLRVDKCILNRQMQYFLRLIASWLTL